MECNKFVTHLTRSTQSLVGCQPEVGILSSFVGAKWDDEKWRLHKYLSRTCAHKCQYCLSKTNSYKLTLWAKRAAESRLKMVYVHATFLHFKLLPHIDFLSCFFPLLLTDSNALYGSSLFSDCSMLSHERCRRQTDGEIEEKKLK